MSSNILTDELPSAVEIAGVEYAIETDWRTCLRIILAFEDPALANIERQWVLLDNLYPVQPHDLAGAISQGIKFLNGGSLESGEGEASPRVFSFAKDANLIFAAFRQTHGIDLASAEMHWWQFLALFMDLGGDTTFCSLVGLRKRIKTGKATKDERQVARDMGDLFDLPELDDRSLEERDAEDEFMRLIREGEMMRGRGL